MLSTVIGAALGSAIDGADGDDSTIDGALGGALGGAAAALAIRTLMPLALTYATGWLVLHGIGRARDAVFGGGKEAA